MKNIYKNLKTLALISGLAMPITHAFANVGYWASLPQMPNNYESTSINSIAVDSKGNVYAATGYSQFQGIAYKLNRYSSTWQQLGRTSPDNSAFNAITVDKNGNVFVGTGYGHVYKMRAVESQWQPVGESTLLGTVLKIAVSAESSYYAEKVYVSTGGGAYRINPNTDQSWQAVVGYNPYSPDGSFISSIALDPYDNFYIGTESGGVYKAVASSNQWKLVGGRNTPSNSPVFAIGLTSRSIFEGSWKGNFYQILNESGSWQNPAGKAPDGNQINTIAVDKLNNVFVGTGSLTPGNVYRLSPSAYNQWTQIGGTSPDGSPVNNSAVDLYNNVYVSTVHNIYLLENASSLSQ